MNPKLKDNFVEKLGSDLKAPINSIFEPITGVDLLLQDIQLLLLTSPGERVNRPDYGSGLKRLLWENEDTVLASAPQEIRACLAKYEPRITVMAVNSTINRNTGLLIFNIKFIINATGSQQNLVFPLRLANQLTFG